MQIPFTRKTEYTYKYERERLLNWLNDADPESDDYEKVMHRLNELDRMQKRTSELVKTAIPAAATVISVGGIYALQQFAGIIVPKVLESIAARQEQKKSNKDD